MVEIYVEQFYQDNVVFTFNTYHKVEVATITFLYKNGTLIEGLKTRAAAKDIYGRYE
jgi:hypothetical protein